MTEEFIGKQKECLEKELLEIYEDLEKKNESLKEQREHIQSQSQASNNHIDIVNELVSLRMEERMGFREDEIVPQIILALYKIKQGNYGQCEHCKKQIAEARLEAIPYAQACIDCQQKLNDDWRKANGEYIHYYWKLVSNASHLKYWHGNADTSDIAGLNHK